VSDKMDKTRVVLVERVQMHPLYKKRYVVRKKFYVHDENNESKVGDIVRIRESKPISRLKRWVLVEIVERSS
jgi:small subunit ribosomal protein S17